MSNCLKKHNPFDFICYFTYDIKRLCISLFRVKKIHILNQQYSKIVRQIS